MYTVWDRWNSRLVPKWHKKLRHVARASKRGPQPETASAAGLYDTKSFLANSLEQPRHLCVRNLVSKRISGYGQSSTKFSCVKRGSLSGSIEIQRKRTACLEPWQSIYPRHIRADFSLSTSKGRKDLSSRSVFP